MTEGGLSGYVRLVDSLCSCRAAAAARSERKERMWEKFGEAMGKDFRKTIWHLRRGNGEPSKLCTIRMRFC